MGCRCLGGGWASSLDVGVGASRGGGSQPALTSPDPCLDRVPLHRFTSIRRTMSEMGGPMEDLIAKGPISKYSQGVTAVTKGPIPEILKNYMDVSFGGGVVRPGAGGAG